MACFLVPGAEAIVVTAVYAVVKSKEKKLSLEAPKLSGENQIKDSQTKISRSKKLGWLMSLLWGGVALLAFEHFWHGEVVPYAPFLTAMSSPGDTAEMLHEMSTVGVSMAALVTLVWIAMCCAADLIVKRGGKAKSVKTAKENMQ